MEKKAYMVAWICSGCSKIHSGVFPGVNMEEETARREELIASFQEDNEQYFCTELPFVGTVSESTQDELPDLGTLLRAMLGE